MQQEVKPYEESESKKGQVSRMFNKIAPTYDLLNRVLSMGIDRSWRRKAVAALGDAGKGYVLDVATGTADVALEIARQHQPQKIEGIDIANEMLEIGRQKVARRGMSDRIVLSQGDSENISYPDNTFDAVTVAFGVRNFEHLERGLREMHRVLKPEGKLVVLEFSKPRIFPFKHLYHFYFSQVLPAIGRLQSKDPRAYQYLYESVQAFPDGKAFERVLEQSGFKETTCTPLTLGICSLYTAQK